MKPVDLSGIVDANDSLIVVDGGARNGPLPFPAGRVDAFAREQAKPVGMREKVKRVVERFFNIEGRAFDWKLGKGSAMPSRPENAR